jgi:hypothetical protein
MVIRPYLPSDSESVKALHSAQGLPYEFPDFEKPEFVVRAVLENGTGRPEMFLALRKTAETFLIFDPQQSRKRDIYGRILAMTKECVPAARRAGLTDVFCVIPPQIARFGDVLEHLGWTSEPWPYYFRKVDL